MNPNRIRVGASYRSQQHEYIRENHGFRVMETLKLPDPEPVDPNPASLPTLNLSGSKGSCSVVARANQHNLRTNRRGTQEVVTSLSHCARRGL
jgi:hypothetical protein